MPTDEEMTVIERHAQRIAKRLGESEPSPIEILRDEVFRVWVDGYATCAANEDRATPEAIARRIWHDIRFPRVPGA